MLRAGVRERSRSGVSKEVRGCFYDTSGEDETSLPSYVQVKSLAVRFGLATPKTVHCMDLDTLRFRCFDFGQGNTPVFDGEELGYLE